MLHTTETLTFFKRQPINPERKTSKAKVKSTNRKVFLFWHILMTFESNFGRRLWEFHKQIFRRRLCNGTATNYLFSSLALAWLIRISSLRNIRLLRRLPSEGRRPRCEMQRHSDGSVFWLSCCTLFDSDTLIITSETFNWTQPSVRTVSPQSTCSQVKVKCIRSWVAIAITEPALITSSCTVNVGLVWN